MTQLDKTMAVNDSHSLNAASQISDTPSGMLIDDNFSHYSKAYRPM